MAKRYRACLLVVLAVLLGGCLRSVLPAAQPGNLQIAAVFPETSDGEGVNVSEVVFTVTNGKQTYHKTEMFSGSKQVVTAFSDLQPGDWDVDVVAKEAVESTKYDVFHGQGQSTVVAKRQHLPKLK